MTEAMDSRPLTWADGLKLENVGREVRIPAGSLVVRQGDPPRCFYVVLSGRLEVFRETTDGIRTRLTELGPGDYFGEVALVTGQPRTASVAAREDALLLEITKEEFDHVLDHNPKLARHIIQQLSHWLVQGDGRLEREVVHQAKLRQISWFDYLLMVGLSLVLALVFNLYNDNQIPLVHGWGEKLTVAEISPTRALELHRRQAAVFVDARKANFYEQRHIRGAINLPRLYFDLQYPMFRFILEQMGWQNRPLIVYGGNFSRRFDHELAHLLQEKDHGQVFVLAGHHAAWEKLFPVEEKAAAPPPAMPLGIPGLIEWLPVGFLALLLIPPVRRSPHLAMAGRLVLGVIFIQFALSKIMRPGVFALNVVEYGLMPPWGVNLWALFLPWAELVCGLFLILGIRTRAAATLIGGMNLIFIIGLVNALLTGLPINCGCVGEVGEPVNWWKVTKNAGMLLMAGQIYLYDRFLVLDRGGFIWREREI
ncbi:MAG: cyclic nucleotide-binding domain-containing protein [Syntrophobacterales bacterium]|nr:cyclic nucleotide-binding domain-containing protein [Syntrophobacterales bacterium]